MGIELGKEQGESKVTPVSALVMRLDMIGCGDHGGGGGFNMAGAQELYFGNAKFEILGRHPPWEREYKAEGSESGGQESALARVLRVWGCC